MSSLIKTLNIFPTERTLINRERARAGYQARACLPAQLPPAPADLPNRLELVPSWPAAAGSCPGRQLGSRSPGQAPPPPPPRGMDGCGAPSPATPPPPVPWEQGLPCLLCRHTGMPKAPAHALSTPHRTCAPRWLQVLPYLLSKLAAELPIGALFPALFAAITYPATGLNPRLHRWGWLGWLAGCLCQGWALPT